MSYISYLAPEEEGYRHNNFINDRENNSVENELKEKNA